MSDLDDEENGDVGGEEEVESVDESVDESVEESSSDLEDEYAEDLDEDQLDEFDGVDEDLKVVDEVLSHKDQNARALAIRRAIEERLEAKRLSKDLDYLDLDMDTED